MCRHCLCLPPFNFPLMRMESSKSVESRQCKSQNGTPRETSERLHVDEAYFRTMRKACALEMGDPMRTELQKLVRLEESIRCKQRILGVCSILRKRAV